MRITVAIGIALATALPSAHGAEVPMTPGQVFGSASPSVVVMNALDPAGVPAAQGSGVVIAHEVVVSNCHVFTSAHNATVTVGGETLPATPRHADTERDLCSFTVPDLRAPPARLGATASLNVGDRVYSIGAPRGFELTLSDGLVSSIRTIDGGRLLQITAPISPGSSGGGLFDGSGKLIGITTMQWKESQQLNFAVPIEWVTELPRRDAKRRKGSVETQTAALSAAQERGRLALNALGVELESADPSGYASKLADLRAAVLRIKDTSPPDDWANAARRAYYAIPSKAPSSTPVLTAGVPAIYPVHVAAAGIGGTTLLVISLDTQGVPVKVQVEKSSKNSDLDQAAVNAVWGWRFRPEIVDGAPVPSRVRVPVDFAPPVREEGVVTGQQDRWALTYEDETQRIHLDTQSYKNHGDTIGGWFRTTFAKPQGFGKHEGVSHYLTHERYDCPRRTIATADIVLYSSTGQLISSRGSHFRAAESVVPGSIGETKWQSLCE